MPVFRCFLLLLLAGLLAQPAAAQGLIKLRRAWLDPVDSVTVMPSYALDEDLTGLLIYSSYPRNGNVAPRGYWFSWPFTSIDGQLGLYITRQQMYLQSGHNNPNPNHLYWVQNISPVQFQAINAVLGRLLVPLSFQTAPGTDCGYFRCLRFQPKESANVSLDTEAQWEAFRRQEEADLAQRVRGLLQELNYHLPSNGQLHLPADADLFDHRTHVAWSVDELLHGGLIYLRHNRPDAKLTRNFQVQNDATLVLGQQPYRLDHDYLLSGYTEQPATYGLTLQWQRKPGVSPRLPTMLTLHCRKVDKLVVTPADAAQAPALDQQLWFAHLPNDSEEYELVLGLESGRTLHISCAEARLTAAP